MKFRTMASVAAVCLMAPSLVLAQPGQDQKDKKEQGQPQGRGRGEHRGNGQQGGRGQDQRQAPPQPQAQPQARPQTQPPAQSQPQPQRGGPPGREGGARPERGGQPARPQPQAQPQPQARPEARPEARQAPPGRGGPPVRGQIARPTGPQPALGAWTAPVRGPTRDRTAQAWRQQNQSWDRTAIWRRQPDFWRYDPAFVGFGFSGLRVGFFFVPDRGYIPLPRAYRNRVWREGDYLPAWFRAYAVRDPWRYGLPRPPRGCVWVWLNGDVALIDRADGYILDIARRVW